MKIFKLNNIWFTNSKYKDNIKKLINSNKASDASYNINKNTNSYYTYNIPEEVINSVSYFSKVISNLQKQKPYDTNIMLNQMKRLEVSLVLHNIISPKEANIVFNKRVGL